MSTSSYLNSSHWLVAFPNVPNGSHDSVLKRVNAAMVEAAGKTLADVHLFNVPTNSLRAGTLDSLMKLADEVAKSDAFVEGIVRKAERLVTDAYIAIEISKRSQNLKEGEEPPAPHTIPPIAFQVVKTLTNDYLTNFSWSPERYDLKEHLGDILRRLVSQAEKADTELRTVANVYQERKNALQVLERKKAGNLMVTGLEDVITPEALTRAGADWIPRKSEFLESFAIVIPKTMEEEFMANYENLDNQAVPMGPESDREAVRGSPVVPDSARKIAEDKEGYCLYTVIILKQFADSFRSACRSARYSIRDFVYRPSNAGATAREISQLQSDTFSALQALQLKARNTYGQCVIAWAHIKAIRVYVESVLRYGLPVNFSALMIRPTHTDGPNGSKKLLSALHSAWKSQAGDVTVFDAKYEDSNDMIIPGVTDTVSSFPFVFLYFDVKETTQISK